MNQKEIIKKIEETGIKPSVIITSEGKCIKAFPECYNKENGMMEYQTVDKTRASIPISDIVSIFTSKDLFSMIMDREPIINIEGKEYKIKKRKISNEEHLVTRFPYNLLIRCASLIRQAEHNFFDFCCEYGKYITEIGETSLELSFFDGIPITDDERYLLYLQVEDCTVTDFSIVSKPILNYVSKEIME